ncbi:MAG TPA: sigma-70 family RNA polymerase sigma factor [Thermomicrobiales bacterium]|nr:sigma-70 family RNA polymerase sigma factor [Thermomicrobiales bacterium]
MTVGNTASRPDFAGASSVDVDFERLHRRYSRDVLHLVQGLIPDRGHAEDVAQETFLRAFRSYHTFDRSRPVWPWLATIARNLSYNALRNMRHRGRGKTCEVAWKDLDDEAHAARDMDPEEVLARVQRRDAIIAALESLHPRSRRFLVQRVFEGISYSEIARTEGVTVDSAKALVKRARKSFKEAYSESIATDAEEPIAYRTSV